MRIALFVGLLLATLWWRPAEARQPATLPGPGGAEDEVVFDVRPRIVLPGLGQPTGQALTPTPINDVHLRVFRRRAREPDCARQSKRVHLDGDRVGVVLSGGISKGLAFVGALDVLDRIGIRVDRITGTSMGAVVGALYAAGYSPQQIYFPEDAEVEVAKRRDILGRINWRMLFTDIPDPEWLSLNQQASWGLGEGANALPRVYQGGARSGQNLSAQLGRYLLAATAASDGCFNNLYVPFSATATNVTDAEAASIHNGSLAVAVRASLSFPALLTPTFIDGSRYIDGGILNNFPVREVIDGDLQVPDPQPVANKVGMPIQAQPSEPMQGRIRAILGFDVSNTSSPPLRPPKLAPLMAVLEGIGAVNDGISATISRETKRSSEALPSCNLDEGPPPGNGPCLLKFKFTLDGGFTDFAAPQIDAFVRSGRQFVLAELCQQFRCGLSESWKRIEGSKASTKAEPTAVQRAERRKLEDDTVAAVRDRIRFSKWHFLLRDGQDHVTRVVDMQPEVLAHRDQLRRLMVALDAATVARSMDSADTDAWRGTLEGLELTLEADGSLKVTGAAGLLKDPARRDRVMSAARAGVSWLWRQLTPPQDGAMQAGDAQVPVELHGLSSLRVTARSSQVVVRAVSWQYQVRGMISSNGLTERGTLRDASVDYWGVAAPAREKHRRQLKCKYSERPKSDSTDCPADVASDLTEVPRERADGLGLTLSLSSRGREVKPVPVNRWKLQAYEALRGRRFDVRYFGAPQRRCDRQPAKEGCPEAPSLAHLLEGLQEHYYTNAAVEYARMDGIDIDAIEVAEKNTHRTAYGSLFGSYQYDYRNKHTYGLKYVYETDNDHWLKPTRVITSAAINEPSRNLSTMYLLDMNLLFFPRIDRPEAFDYSLNPYRARRNHRIGVGIPEFSYLETGLSLTASLRPPRARDGESSLLSGYVGVRLRRIGEVEATRLDLVQQLLRDPGLGTADRSFKSATVGARGVQYLQTLTFSETAQVSLHRANGTVAWDYSLDAAMERAADTGPDSAITGVRILWAALTHLKGADRQVAGKALPVDEIYSMGGYFPLAERTVWGRKRIDYLGADINELWGTRVLMFEARHSLWRMSEISYFAPFAKLQLDVLVQRANIGFVADPSRRWRTASGLVFSAYAPPLASLKARLSLAYGGERLSDMRFFSSLDIVF